MRDHYTECDRCHKRIVHQKDCVGWIRIEVIYFEPHLDGKLLDLCEKCKVVFEAFILGV